MGKALTIAQVRLNPHKILIVKLRAASTRVSAPTRRIFGSRVGIQRMVGPVNFYGARNTAGVYGVASRYSFDSSEWKSTGAGPAGCQTPGPTTRYHPPMGLEVWRSTTLRGRHGDSNGLTELSDESICGTGNSQACFSGYQIVARRCSLAPSFI